MTETKDPRQNLLAGQLVDFVPCPDTDGFAVLRVGAQEGPMPDFTPGQFTRLVFEGDGEFQQRFFTMASAPHQTDAWEFFVVEKSKSGGTAALATLPPDTPIWFAKPAGKFTTARATHNKLILAADGTGIAPYVSMIRHWSTHPKAAPAAVELWCGFQNPAELIYQEELLAIQQQAPFPLTLHPEDGDLCQALTARLAGATVDASVFLCGNPTFIQAVEAWADDTPWKEVLVFERWW
jgi:ferredoxin-NADP reductase